MHKKLLIDKIPNKPFGVLFEIIRKMLKVKIYSLRCFYDVLLMYCCGN